MHLEAKKMAQNDSIINVYFYKGFYFDVIPEVRAIKLKKDLSDAAAHGRTFWKVIDEWEKLTDEEKSKTTLKQ